MNKLDYKHQALNLPVAPPPDLEPACRLIVLVPSLDFDLDAVTRRVWELASGTGARIKFLSLYSDMAQEPGLRRRLATMAALVKDGTVSADSEVIWGRNWVEAVRSRRQAGDMVVCCSEQRAGLTKRPLSQILQSDLDIPLYVLSGLYPRGDSHPAWLPRIVVWVGFFAIILGFFILQIKIDQIAQELTITLQLLVTAVEFWLIWIWNNLFR